MVTADLEYYAQAARDALGGECVRVFTHGAVVAVEHMTRSGRMLTTLEQKLGADPYGCSAMVMAWESKTEVRVDCDNPAMVTFIERRGYICEALDASLRRAAAVFGGLTSDVAAHFGRPGDADIIHSIVLDALIERRVSAW